MGNNTNQCMCKKNDKNKYSCSSSCANANKSCKTNADCTISHESFTQVSKSKCISIKQNIYKQKK